MFTSRATLPVVCVAILCMIGSTCFFSLMNVFTRMATFDMHIAQIVFLRNLFSVGLLLPWVLRHGSGVLHTHRIKDHFWRGTLGVIGMHLWFYSIATLPLNHATALSFTAPIFMTIFAIIFLGERVGVHRWSAIVVGFIGAMVIIRPSPSDMQWESFIVFLATSFWASAGMLVKSLTKTEPTNRIVFYMSVVMASWSLPFALWHWTLPTPDQLWLIFGIALASTVSHIFLVNAYSRVDVVVLMPFDFFRLIFTAMFAYIAFGEIADRWTWMGAAIIVTSAAYIARREAIRRKQKETTPA